MFMVLLAQIILLHIFLYVSISWRSVRVSGGVVIKSGIAESQDICYCTYLLLCNNVTTKHSNIKRGIYYLTVSWVRNPNTAQLDPQLPGSSTRLSARCEPGLQSHWTVQLGKKLLPSLCSFWWDSIPRELWDQWPRSLLAVHPQLLVTWTSAQSD